MPFDVSGLSGISFDELHSSLLLSVGDGVTINGSTYVAGPSGLGLANYDNWIGTLGAPDDGDTVSINTFIPATATPNVIEYTVTTGDGNTTPTTGGIGAEVVATNNNGYLLEQLTGYFPGTHATITPDGNYFILETGVDLSVTDGSPGPTTAELTFSAANTVPEPSTMMLMPIMVIALVVSRMSRVRGFLGAR